MASKNYAGNVFNRTNRTIDRFMNVIDERREHPHWYEDNHKVDDNVMANCSTADDGARVWSF